MKVNFFLILQDWNIETFVIFFAKNDKLDRAEFNVPLDTL